jgi:hypothetical protein
MEAQRASLSQIQVSGTHNSANGVGERRLEKLGQVGGVRDESAEFLGVNTLEVTGQGDK